MSDQHETGADVAIKVAGQEFNVKNVKSLNTLLTLGTFVAVVMLGYAFWMHAADTKDASRELVQALKEGTQAAREQNCLISMPQERRDPELCRRIAR